MVIILPSERRQTVISSKGLITLPEPWRNYSDLQPKDGVIVKWDKFLIVYPEKMGEPTKAQNALMVALLENRIEPELLGTLWEQLSQSIRGDLFRQFWYTLDGEQQEKIKLASAAGIFGISADPEGSSSTAEE